MPNIEIENIIKNVQENKNQDYDSYIFYNPSLKKDREIYVDYSRKMGKKKNNLITSANEYIKRSNQYFGVSAVTTILEEKGSFNNAELNSIRKARNKLFAEGLEVLFDAMEESRLTDLFIDRHNQLCEKNKLEVLQVSKDQVLNEFDTEVNSRDKMLIVYMKNTFWLNKYVKMLSSMESQAFFDDSLMPRTTNNLSDDELSYLLYMASAKYDIVKQIYRDGVRDQDERRTLQLCREYKGIYNKTFNDIFPNSANDILDDYDKVKNIELVKDDLYERKNVFTNILLRNQIIESNINTLNPGIKNWGVSNRDNDPNSIVLVLEPERYMLPASFHIPKYIYSNVFKSFGINKYKFPEMNIVDRLDYKNRFFSTNVLVKPIPEQAKQIKLEAKQSKGEKQQFLKRVLDQINGRAHSATVPNTVEIEIGE